jgi:hypothetical protein
MVEPQLQSLMAYTIFHIGVYVSLFTALIGVRLFTNLDYAIVKFAVASFLIAGLCGGIIAGHIPHYKDADTFFADKIGPFGSNMFRFKVWAFIEHTSFWIGISLIAAPYFCGCSLFKKQATEK